MPFAAAVLSVIGRRVRIEQVLKSGTKTVLERNPWDVSVVLRMDKLAVNTRAYCSSLIGAEKPLAKSLPSRYR